MKTTRANSLSSSAAKDKQTINLEVLRTGIATDIEVSSAIRSITT